MALAEIGYAPNGLFAFYDRAAIHAVFVIQCGISYKNARREYIYDKHASGILNQIIMIATALLQYKSCLNVADVSEWIIINI